MVTERFEMRLDEQLLSQVDEWRARQDDVPTRSEAMRRLIELGLYTDSTKFSLKLTDGDKLNFGMLRDIHRHLGIKEETDSEYMMEVISGGHYWAPKWDKPGLFHDYSDKPHVVQETANYLDMWSFIEDAYENLSAAQKEEVMVATEVSNVKFMGFDGNNEAEYMSVAHMFINHMDRWQIFKGRSMNSHLQVVGRYRRMFEIFEPMRQGLSGKALNVKQLIKILQERKRG